MKRFLIWIVIIMLLLTHPATSLAYSGYDYTKNTAVAETLTGILNGTIPIFDGEGGYAVETSIGGNNVTHYYKNYYYSGATCFIYANAVYYKLFGISPHYEGVNVASSVGSTSISYNALKNAGVKCGTYMRAGDNNNGHSIIILSFDSSSVTWLDANANGDGVIRIHTKSYSEVNSVFLNYKGRTLTKVVIPTYEETPANNLEFRDVAYPKTFVINPSRGWDVTRGSVVSNMNLTSIQSILSKNDGSWKQDTGAVNISGHYYPLSSLDTSIKFSQIPSAGDYTWTLIAKDSNNRTLRMDMPFKAVTSGNTDTATAKKEWKRNEDESEHHYDIWGSTSRSAVFYVNSQASNSSIQLKSETGKALVNQHTMGISSGTGEETHHGFYLVNISYVGGQYRNEFVWAPSATTNTSGVELSANMKITFPAIGAYRVEIKPLSNSQASNYWKVDSIAQWNKDAIWHYVDKSNTNCTVSKNAPPTIEFSGEGVPSGNLSKGQSYELRGVVSASENIQSVTATIYDVSTQKAVSGIGTNPITIYPNSKSVDIYWSQINTSLKFGSMNDGAYRYELVVTTASGWKKTVADSTFTIGNCVLGDADGNGVFDFDDILWMIDYYCGLKKTIASANCDLNGNGKVCDFDDILNAIDLYCR